MAFDETYDELHQDDDRHEEDRWFTQLALVRTEPEPAATLVAAIATAMPAGTLFDSLKLVRGPRRETVKLEFWFRLERPIEGREARLAFEASIDAIAGVVDTELVDE